MGKKTEYVQCVLTRYLSASGTLSGSALPKESVTKVCWLDQPDTFKEGSIISLKGETTLWRVLSISKTRKSKEYLMQDWVVGGLEKRKKEER